MKKMNKGKLARVIATWLVTSIMVSVFVLDIITLILDNRYVEEISITDEDFSYTTGDDRIHFLNTANSDCILIESDGHFALIDSGEGDENPRKKTEYNGFRDEVTSYIKKVAADKNGKVTLDFILATHMHYDHAGNFKDIINDVDIEIGTAYIKTYDIHNNSDMEKEDWGNEKTYNDIIAALEKKNIAIMQKIPPNEFTFGDFTVRFINVETPQEAKKHGENANSVGTILVKGDKKVFLAADITANTGLEELYAEEIGDVDVLKIGHHGYYGSSSADFLRTLKPEIAICTNYLGKIYPNVKWNLTMVAKAPVYSTAHRNGIIATFTDDGEIILTQNIM